MYRKQKNIKDILYILEHLRKEDRIEAVAQKGENYIWECLKEIMDYNGHFVLGCKKSDDTPVCMGGCVSTEDKTIGIVWLLCTDEIVKYQTCLLKNLKKDIQELDKKYWMLCNMLYCENRLAKKWLEKFGFRFDNILNAKLPDGFEFFYKKRNLRGLNNANCTTIS